MAQLVLIILFILYGIPSFHLRYAFRSRVYNDYSWKISFKPYFVKETIALFTNSYFKSKRDISVANWYRIYLFVYLLLFIAIFVV